MKTTPEQLAALSRETSLSLAAGTWPDFLRTAAWTSKYAFRDQLLIFAQKPDATACAPYEVWTNARYQRMPRKGTAIALLNASGNSAGKHYVFDVSDTFVRRGAQDPEDPVWHITPEEEPTIRRTLAERYLPYEQRSEAHLTCAPGDFYRSIAFQVVLSHSEELLRQLAQIQHTCELHMFPEVEIERILLNLLSESLSAILQHRCGHKPDVRNDILATVRHFNSEEAISILGTATQHLAQEALSDLNREEPAKTAGKPLQGRGEASEAPSRYNSTQMHETSSERPQMPSERLEGISALGLCEEDIDRVIAAGPPLEGGKFRLYVAAKDPDTTPEQLTELLRKEYGTGQRMFMLSDGSLANLSWSPSELAVGPSGFSGVSPLTLPWEFVSAQLNRLVGQNLYLTPAEAGHVEDYLDAQKAMQGRQRAGAAILALLQIFETDRGSLRKSQEQVRAYVHENNEVARQTLSGRLLALSTLPSVQYDETAFATLRALQIILSERSEGEHTLSNAASECNFSPAQKEESIHLKQNASHSSHNACKGNSHYSHFREHFVGSDCAAIPVKVIPITVNAQNYDPMDFSFHSVHTLRSAISSLLSTQYPAYISLLGGDRATSALGSDKLALILSDFTEASSKRASDTDDISLRTLDYSGSILAALAFRMRQMPDSDVSRTGREVLGMLEALYDTNEATLHKFAQASDWLLGPYASPSVLSFGPMDAVHLEGNTYDIQNINGDAIQLVSRNTGETLPPTDAEELSRRIRAHAGNRLFPAWSRGVPSQIYQREDQKLLAELLLHFGTWCDCDSIHIPGAYYEAIQNHLISARVSDDAAANGNLILQAATAIRQFFPQPDSIPERGRETARLLSRAGEWLELPRHLYSQREPEWDHPELFRMDQSRLNRSDKVALADLLYHFGTYQWTFTNNTPALCVHDAERREVELSLMDTMRVSDSVEENLENIRIAKTILARWFLPVEGVRPEILERQQVILTAADRVLLDPPKQSDKPTHTHTHTHTHTQAQPVEPVAFGETGGEILWDYGQPALPLDQHTEKHPLAPIASNTPVPFDRRLQSALDRAARTKTEVQTQSKEPELVFT